MEGRDYVANGNTNLGYNGLQYATTQKTTTGITRRRNAGYLPVHPILLTMLIILQLLIVEMVLQFLVRIINGVISMLSAVHGVLLMRSSWRKFVFE